MTTSRLKSNPKPQANILTIDVEDWYQGISRYVKVPSPDHRLQRSLPIILNLLKKYRVKATFFILGEIAQNFPELVEQIIADDHEIGCHGFSHRHLDKYEINVFDEELRKATRLLEKLCKDRIRSFRAPLFSITKATHWALKIIKKHGYVFDSSIFPTYHPFYGIPDEPCQPHYVSFGNGNSEDVDDRIMEFPILTRKFLGVNLPIGGGAYLRFLGKRFMANSIINMNKRGWPATIYIHPWELECYVPETYFNPATKFITFHNVGKPKEQLEDLFKKFKFVSIRDFAGDP